MNRLRGFSVVLAILLALLLAACGGDDDSVSQEELEAATEEAAQEARDEAKEDADIAELEDEIKALREEKDQPAPDASTPPPTDDSGSSGGLPSDAEDCGSGIYARSGTTSCAFALNVAADFFAAGGGSFDSFSPATGEIYRMTCTGGAVTTCTGGNNAAVYILSS